MATDFLEVHQPISAADRDKMPPVWDMSQERAFIENLLARRFNFFLVFFSIVMAGSVNARTQLQLQLVLGIGATISVLFAMVLTRSQEKLDIVLADLFRDDSHPATIVDRRSKPGGGRRRLLGIWIPRLCCAILLVGFLLAIGCVLVVPNASIGLGGVDAKTSRADPSSNGSPTGFFRFMADWGLWDIIGLMGAIIPTIAVLWYLVPRKAIPNFYVDTHRDSANPPYSKIVRIELRNHTNEPLYLLSEGFIFGNMIRASTDATKDAATQVYELKFAGPDLNNLTEIDILLRPRQSISTWIPIDPSQTDEDIDEAIRHRSVGTLRLKCKRLSDRRQGTIPLWIPV